MRTLTPIERAELASNILRDGALKLERFEDCFTSVAELFDARSFHLVHISKDGHQTFCGAEPTLEILDAYMRGQWEARDSWSARAKRATRSGQIVTDSELIAPDLRKMDPFFQEFGRTWNLQHYAAWTFGIEDETFGFTFMRPEGLEFTAEEIQALSVLKGAAENAAHLAAHFRRARMVGFVQGLEASGRPSIILDHRGRVSFMTSGTEKYIGSALHVKAGVLRGADAATNANFARVKSWIAGGATSLPNAFRVTSSVLTKELIAICIPIQRENIVDLPGPSVILTFIDRAAPRPINRNLLAELYGLTRRECELAQELASGRSLETAAQHLGVKISTVRQMMKTLMAKTGVNRQADLALLISRCL